MSTQNYPDWSNWTNWSGPLTELQKINQEASERVIRECISFCSDTTGTAIKCMQTMPRITSPEDYFNLQMKLFSQQGEKVLEFTQNVFNIYQDTLKDHFHWTEDKVGTLGKKAAAATSSVTSKFKKEEAA